MRHLTRFSLIIASLLSPAFAFAAIDPKTALCNGTAGLKTDCAPESGHSLATYISNITDALLVIAGAIAVLIIIAGGIMYITSTGEAKRIQQAKDTILYAVIGLVVIILAYAIVSFTIGAISK